MGKEKEKATCRGCKRILKGDEYCYGGNAFLPEGGLAKINHYGGFVCSEDCDRSASFKLENSMPGACSGGNKRLSCFAQNSLNSNWSE